jgi:hypothetical protein
MEDANIKAATAMGTRRPRQGEAFWDEMVATWKASGIGARRFCREQGLAVSTFSLWRKKLASPVRKIKQPLAVLRMRHSSFPIRMVNWLPQGRLLQRKRLMCRHRVKG